MDRQSQILKALNDPVMIDAGYLDVLLSMPDQQAAFFSSRRGRAASSSGLEVIPVYGVLAHRANGFLSWLFNDSFYEEIGARFKAALADDSVKSIIFDIDSPGGEVAGVFDLVDAIHAAKGKKQIIAVANEAALSAAYAIGSAADKFYLSRTAQVGSIGVIAMHVDRSGLNEKAGLKVTPIYAGARKNDFTPHEPLSKEAFQAAQESVNRTYDLFASTVSRNRGISIEAIKKTEAGVFTGQDAVKMGLADGILTFDQALKTVQEGGFIMGLKTDLRALLAGKSDAEIAEAMEACGYIPKGTAGVDAEKIKADALGGVKEILSLCEIGGVSSLRFAAGLIESGASPEDAKKQILDAKANTDKNSEIFSTVGAISTGAVNPLIADARRRAGKEA